MIIAVRISGQPGLSEKVKEALFRIRLRRKYSAVLIEPTQENLKIFPNIIPKSVLLNIMILQWHKIMRGCSSFP